MNDALRPEEIIMSFDNDNDINLLFEDSSLGGDYPPLKNKPQINDVTLIGNKTSEELGLQEKLESGTNIKTINGNSILGEGNLVIEGGGDAVLESALTSAMTYKGSVATYEDLPSSGNKIGDFYNVLSNGKNYAWDGTKWDDAGGTVDLSTVWQKSELVAITTAEIDTLFA